MNKVIRIQSIFLVISLILIIFSPGCKPELKEGKKMTIPAVSTPAGIDNLHEKGIIPHKAKFSRKWEE